MPGDFGGPVCSCAPYHYFCTRDRGCTVHPASPTPFGLRAGDLWQASSKKACCEIVNLCLNVNLCFDVIVPSNISTSLRGALATKQSTLTFLLAARWIASRSLSSGRASRGPVGPQ